MKILKAPIHALILILQALRGLLSMLINLLYLLR